MPTLTLEVPAEMLAALEKKATQKQRSLDEEALDALSERVAEVPRRQPGPVFMTEEIVAPFIIPHPPGVPVEPIFKGEYKPDFSALIKELKELEELGK